MIENKNALAELAAELKRSLDLQMPGTSYYRDRTVFCTPEVIDKSMRIVAELAKVDAIKRKLDSQMPTESIDVWSKTMNEWVEADRHVVDRCRAIAEEGANNGK